MSEKEPLVKVKGVPGALLLPAREFKFKVYPGNYIIEIPRKGAFKDLDSTFFTEKDGEFHFMHEDTFYMPSLSKVLFATSKYPDLKDNQAFAIIGLKIKEDTVEIIGNLIEFLAVGEENDDNVS